MQQTDIAAVRQNQATIQDVTFVPLTPHVDERGYLVEILRAVDPHFSKFGQVYLVGNFARGVIRAFHKHEVLWDWFFISHGAAKFVLVDDRRGSPTYGRMNIFVTSDRNPNLIAVPPGVYHGWISLEDDTQMISIASEVYNRTQPDEVRVSPDSFGDVWTVKGR
jgi:dTDP-4-dehydrorhamnose 3,5-epimerase